MMFSLFKAILFLNLTISQWQTYNYSELVKRLSEPTQPITTIKDVDENTLNFLSYSAINDQYNVYTNVMHDISSIPSWLVLIRQNNRIKNELSHRGIHDGILCNVYYNNEILFHITTVGFQTNIIFRVKFKVQNTEHGVIIQTEIDKTFRSEQVEDFRMLLWAFPHPSNKNLVIVISQGYIKTSLPVFIFNSPIKIHIDNMMQNFADRVTMVKNDQM